MNLLEDLDIARAGERLRTGALTSVALTRACLDRIESLNARLNAFITVTADEALSQAADADEAIARGDWRGPLHGIPISLKDIVHQQGVPTTAASRAHTHAPAVHDATVTIRLRRAGAVLVGKCNLHEFALGTTTDESAFGPARHPDDETRSPGGSSGGSAIAVATGMSLASIGTDTGGSVRIPAAVCGLVGLKAGLGEIPCAGVVPLSTTCDHVGPLVRSVSDAGILFGALTGTEAPALEDARSLRGMRLGVPRRYFQDRLQAEVRQAFERACRRLIAAGAQLDEVVVDAVEDAPAIYTTIVLAEGGMLHAQTLDREPEAYSPGVRARLRAGRYVLAEDYLRARRGRSAVRSGVDHALRGCDGLVTPTVPILAPPVGATSMTIDGTPEPVRNLMLRLTQPFNLSGHPAITLPCGIAADGLPCGLQIVGHRGRTPDLLRVARRCEPYAAPGPMRGGTG